MVDQKLISLLSIARNASYTEAAKELALTQPAISHQMRQLEEEYGMKMFTYEGRKLQLTEAGSILRTHAESAVARERMLKEKLKGLKSRRKEVRFGATLTIGEFTIAPFLSELFETFPGYHFSLMVDNTKNLMEMLNKGEIHFALIEGLFPKDLYETQLLKTCDFILITSKNHFIAKKKKVLLEDLLDQKLIIREKGSGSREILERALAEKNRSLSSFREVVEMGNVNIMKKMTMEGMGISFMYRDAALEELRDGELVEVSVENFRMEREFNFVQIMDDVISSENQEVAGFFSDKMRR
ncbi:LysR family transcriptional regulator [Proteiniclasticum sp. C24MP]|uniref:LysR family transcriptional regulator n=1 Tax=Proteiniclasticum sp. C24MP TaxID=3374101 RepID=UPI003754137F